MSADFVRRDLFECQRLRNPQLNRDVIENAQNYNKFGKSNPMDLSPYR